MRANYRKLQGGYAWVPYAIAAVASLIGMNQSKKAQQGSAALDRAMQVDLANTGIQRRVADAEKAGLHPVYALGAPPMSFSPVGDGGAGATQQAGWDAAGASVKQALQSGRLEKMQLEAHNAGVAKDIAQAQMYANEAARIKQAMNGGASLPREEGVVVGAYEGAGHPEAHPLFQDAIKLEPDVMVSRRPDEPAVTAGRIHPSMREFTFPGGHRLLLPATGQGGIPEEIDAAMLLHIYAANRNFYGPGFTMEMLRYILFGLGPRDYNTLRGPSVTGKIRR